MNKIYVVILGRMYLWSCQHCWSEVWSDQFRHHPSGKTRILALFWLPTSHHVQRYMKRCYVNRSLLTQSFNIVNTAVILLFSKKWVPGLTAEDNNHYTNDVVLLHLHSCQNHGGSRLFLKWLWNIQMAEIKIKIMALMSSLTSRQDTPRALIDKHVDVTH